MIIKLRNRLIGAIMAFVSVILLLAFVAVYMVTYVRIHRENMEKINSEETVQVTSGERVVENGRLIENAYVVNRISPALGVYFNLVADASGELQYIDSALDLRMEDYESAGTIARNNPDGGITELGGRRWLYSTGSGFYQDAGDNSVLQSDGFVFIRFLDITDSVQTLQTLSVTLIALYIALIGVFFVLARVIANRSVRPMAEAWDSQRQFIADASHELKTPISTLNANLDILYASREEPITQQIKWLDNSKKVLSRMQVLVQNMLELAKVDEWQGNVGAEDVSVDHLLEEAVDSYVPLFMQKDIDVVEAIDSNLGIHSNYSVIQQIVEILLDNAVKYTQHGGTIRVAAWAEKNAVALQIKNSGKGISPTDINRVFDRFYRGDKARVYSEGNYGLGLSIAKAAAEKLGGEIGVKSDAHWTAFTLMIPNRKKRKTK